MLLGYLDPHLGKHTGADSFQQVEVIPDPLTCRQEAMVSGAVTKNQEHKQEGKVKLKHKASNANVRESRGQHHSPGSCKRS